MTEYLFSTPSLRTQTFATLSASQLAGNAFFHLWTNRSAPFAQFAEGDTVLPVGRDNRLVWRWTARAVTKRSYSSHAEVMDLLLGHYAITPDDVETYVLDRPAKGWLLAWAVEVTQPLDVALDSGVSFRRYGAQNGYLPLDRLPEPLRPELPDTGSFEPIGIGLAQVGGIDLPPEIRRFIPADVRRAVWERDGGRCTQCGRGPDEVPIHIDHRYPFARGGGNDVRNLQLLCRDHNLRKGARVLSGITVPSQAPRPRDVARDGSLKQAVESMKAKKGEEAASDYFVSQIDDDTIALDELRLALEVLVDTAAYGLPATRVAEIAWAEGNEILARTLSEPLVASKDRNVRATAALVLGRITEGARKVELLELASAADDPAVVAAANFELALDLVQHCPPEFQRASTYLDEAIIRGDCSLRANAALLKYQLVGGDLEPEETDRLLRLALTSDVPDVRAEAALAMAHREAAGRARRRRLRALVSLAGRAEDPHLKELARALGQDLDDVAVPSPSRVPR